MITALLIGAGVLWLISRKHPQGSASYSNAKSREQFGKIAKVIYYDLGDGKKIMHYWHENGVDFWNINKGFMEEILHQAKTDHAEIVYSRSTDEAMNEYNYLSNMDY